MRIDTSTNYRIQSEVKIHQEQGHTSFTEHLRTAESAQLKQAIDKELSAIAELGQKLVRNMSLSDLREYKERVSNFLRLCISQGFSFDEERLGSRFGRTKILAIVRTVNQKLVDLGKELLSSNKDSLKVLALVDEIRGLLLDLYA